MHRGTTPTAEAQHRAVLDTVDVVYAAALDPGCWNDALDAIVRGCGAEAAGFRVEDGDTLMQRWVGLDPAFDAAYVAHYWRDDPWAAPARAIDAGRVACGTAIVSRRALEGSAFYNDLCRSHGLDDLVGGVIERSAGRLVTLGVMGARGVRFDATQVTFLERLLPHLERALTIGERLLLAPVGGNGNDGALTRATVEDRLRLRFALTAAEARVAVQIGRGCVTKEAAVALGVGVETVRSQLRSVYAKTRTTGQRDLERLVRQLPGH